MSAGLDEGAHLLFGLRMAINNFYCFHQNNDVPRCEVVHTSPPIRSLKVRATDFGLPWQEGSMRGEMINEYQKLNSEDQKAFRRWLWANAVVGGILLTALITLAVHQGDESRATAQNATMHTQAKLP
jgi:hypothetical protein